MVDILRYERKQSCAGLTAEGEAHSLSGYPNVKLLGTWSWHVEAPSNPGFPRFQLHILLGPRETPATRGSWDFLPRCVGLVWN